MGKIRIIGGKYRSRILEVIDSDGLRPTSNRVRETLFNWLGQDLTGKKCLDMFAGSGALGFEALSRNANSVTMLEKNYKVYKYLQSNKQILKVENAILIHADALEYLEICKDKFDVIFLDPPYDSDLLAKSLAMLHNNLSENGVIFIEYENSLDLSRYRIVKSNKYGMVNFALLQLRLPFNS